MRDSWPGSFYRAYPTVQTSDPQFDQIFKALADPTRRLVLERLRAKPASVSELAEPFNMALPSFVQHLSVLERCGLVHSHKKGRVRTYALAPKRLKFAEDWMASQRRLWEARLDQLDAHLLTMKENQHDDEL